MQLSSEKQILAFSLSPFKDLHEKAAGLFQFRVISNVHEKCRFEDAFLKFYTERKVVDLISERTEFSFQELSEKEKKETTRPDNLSLAKDLRVLILSFLFHPIPISHKWHLALTSFSFFLPKFIFTRVNVTFVAGVRPSSWVVLSGVSRSPIIKTKKESESLNVHSNDSGYLCSFLINERLEGYALNVKDGFGLFDGNELIGTPSMYQIQVQSPKFKRFSFLVIQTGKGQKIENDYSFSLEHFLNLKLDTEMECNFKFKE